MNIVKVEHLSKVYGKGENAVYALNDISFSVDRGEFVAIVGASGSGKSTLLHILGGVDRPTSGKVFIDGEDICALNDTQLAIFRRRQVGLIYQLYNLIPVLTVKENIELPLLLDNRQVDETQFKEMVNYLSIADKTEYLPNQLSGGQQQKVSVGRTLFTAPSIVLADEPTGNLDSKNSAEVVKLLKDSNKKHKQTLILITHNEQIAMQADRIITITDGKIVNDEVRR
ncbi:MAG: ABC transporter ATP-binding protein [Oscillospiraceae bacterium]